jgi:hypothetical protein
MGFVALALLLVAEFGLVLWLRGLSVREYLATRDPVSGTVYYVMRAVFAIMLFWLGNDNVAQLRVRRGRPFWRPRH